MTQQYLGAFVSLYGYPLDKTGLYDCFHQLFVGGRFPRFSYTCASVFSQDLLNPEERSIAPSSCEQIDFVTAFACYKALLYYKQTIPNGDTKFPAYSALKINEMNIPCGNIDTFKTCLNDLKSYCYDLPTIFRFVPSGSEAEAKSYLQLFLAMQLRCDHASAYDTYTRCRAAWAGADWQDQTHYANCGDYRYKDECYSINSTMTCRWKVMRSVCEDIGGYCDIDPQIMDKQGWIDGDCISDAKKMCKKINSASRFLLPILITFMLTKIFA
ncbi:unnamed protein product, partial [Mesorhabditis belari]|uniref:Uncharacterized protein n=1 Tax=Mesorhabditis belari TaxID=2138241 RepID=A0AAF3J4G7_9BILA